MLRCSMPTTRSWACGRQRLVVLVEAALMRRCLQLCVFLRLLYLAPERLKRKRHSVLCIAGLARWLRSEVLVIGRNGKLPH